MSMVNLTLKMMLILRIALIPRIFIYKHLCLKAFKLNKLNRHYSNFHYRKLKTKILWHHKSWNQFSLTIKLLLVILVRSRWGLKMTMINCSYRLNLHKYHLKLMIWSMINLLLLLLYKAQKFQSSNSNINNIFKVSKAIVLFKH